MNNHLGSRWLPRWLTLKTKKVEFIICLVVIIWGLLITIFVVSAEYSNWRDNSEIRARLSKLEKCKSHGKETKEGKETPATKETGC